MNLEEQLAPTMPPPPATIPAPATKECGCGASHDAFEWARLPALGLAHGLDWRNCRCGSTLAVALCSVPGCTSRSLYTTDDGAELCAGCEREFHLADDREDFADEYAREDRRERGLDEAAE